MEKRKNLASLRSIDFACRIVDLYRRLSREAPGDFLCRQLLESGTEIGANLAQCKGAADKKEFLEKIDGARQKCSRTFYWLTLLKEASCLSGEEFNSLKNECLGLLKILNASARTLRTQLAPSAPDSQPHPWDFFGETPEKNDSSGFLP